MPELTNRYFKAVFVSGSHQELIFFVYPVVISFALAIFWSIFKTHFSGSIFSRAYKMAAAYAGIAILPSMVITYSVLPVAPGIIIAWLPYGFTQGLIAGLIFASKTP
jgi:hypothetical protein